MALAVKQLRLARGIPFDSLAAGARVPYQTLARIESGLMTRPGPWTLARLARSLGVPERVVRFGEYPDRGAALAFPTLECAAEHVSKLCRRT